MDDDKKIARVLGDAIASDELESIAKDTGELVLDAVLEGGLLKDIPVVSTFVNAIGAIQHVRESFLKRKLLIFITDISQIPPLKRKRFFDEHTPTPEARQRLCELVLHILDDVRSDERARMISALFAALIREELSQTAFRRLCEAVRYLDRDHLVVLARLSPDRPTFTTDPEIHFLLTHALVSQDFTPHSEGHGGRYVVTKLGGELVAALQQVQTGSGPASP